MSFLKQGKMYVSSAEYKLEVKRGYMVNVSVARWPMGGQFGSEVVVVSYT